MMEIHHGELFRALRPGADRGPRISFVTPIADDNIMTFAITFTPRSEDDPHPWLVIGKVQQECPAVGRPSIRLSTAFVSAGCRLMKDQMKIRSIGKLEALDHHWIV
jgi:hypothetical protein